VPVMGYKENKDDDEEVWKKKDNIDQVVMFLL
jgi:hypothetical protein